MLVTVAPTQPMSKSQKKAQGFEEKSSQHYVDLAHDVLDKDMESVCYQYSSLVSMWVINEITANKSTFEEAAAALVRNFMLYQNVKDLRAVGERIEDPDDHSFTKG
jgi:hypothetical protein